MDIDRKRENDTYAARALVDNLHGDVLAIGSVSDLNAFAASQSVGEVTSCSD